MHASRYLLPLLLCAALPGFARAGSGAAGCEIDGDVFAHGPRASGLVAITFDACPTTHVPGFTPEIVERLKEAQVPATFFVSGRWAEAHPSELAQLASVPFFEIALHGYRHRHMNGASEETILREIDDGRQAAVRLGAEPAALFRPPYGEHPRAVAEAARRAGVTPVLWDVAPGDPDPHRTAADIERYVMGHVRGGSIVVMHVNGRGVGTAAALPKLVAAIRKRGLRFVKVSELLPRLRARAGVELILMGGGLHIAAAQRLDTGDCRRLVLASEPWITLGYGEGEVEGIVRSSAIDNLLVARAEGRVVGFALSAPGVLLGEYLKLLAVEESHRARGVGRALMEELERRAFERWPNVYLCVSDFNHGAREFYRRLGYEEIGLLRDLLLPGKGEVLMRKTIGPWRR